MPDGPKILAVAHRHYLGNEIFVGYSDGRETLKTPADVFTVIDRDFFTCKFCGIASSLGFCLKLPEATSPRATCWRVNRRRSTKSETKSLRKPEKIEQKFAHSRLPQGMLRALDRRIGKCWEAT
jgi:hypothetical protein